MNDFRKGTLVKKQIKTVLWKHLCAMAGKNPDGVFSVAENYNNLNIILSGMPGAWLKRGFVIVRKTTNIEELYDESQ